MAKVKKRGNSWQIDYNDPEGKRIRKAFKKKKEAEAELAKRVSLIAEGRYRPGFCRCCRYYSLSICKS
jgi:hypothetical protein